MTEILMTGTVNHETSKQTKSNELQLKCYFRKPPRHSDGAADHENNSGVAGLILDLSSLLDEHPFYYVISQCFQKLRTELIYLKTYLFTCKQSTAEDFRRLIWPRDYLCENVELYSLAVSLAKYRVNKITHEEQDDLALSHQSSNPANINRKQRHNDKSQQNHLETVS